MMSIGVLGFVVWSQIVVAFFYREVEVINFAVCWDSLMLMSTFYSQNLISSVVSAGNLSFLILFSLVEIAWDYVCVLASLTRSHTIYKKPLSCLYTKASGGLRQPETPEKNKGKKTDFVQFVSNYSEVKRYVICWNCLVPIGTFYSKNLIGYAQSAGYILSYSITFVLVDFYDFDLMLCLDPVLFYSNADTQKQLILRENKGKAPEAGRRRGLLRGWCIYLEKYNK